MTKAMRLQSPQREVRRKRRKERKKKKREEKRRVRQSRLTFSTTRCGALRDGKITRTDSTETKRNNRLVHFWTTPRECSHFIISRSVLKAAFLFSDQVRNWSPTRSLPHRPYSEMIKQGDEYWLPINICVHTLCTLYKMIYIYIYISNDHLMIWFENH